MTKDKDAMKLTKKKQYNFYELPKREQKKLLLNAAKFANKQQQALEARYLRMLAQV